MERLLRITILLGVLAVVAVAAAFFLSGDKTHLMKMSAPVTIIIIALAVRNRKRREQEKHKE